METTNPGVLTDGQVVAFERVGEGPPVVVVGATPALRALAAHFRLILPQGVGLEGPEGDRRLADTIEALGLEDPPLVADGRFADPVLRLALRDPWRIRAVALVFESAPGRPVGVPVRTRLDPLGLPALFLPLADALVRPRVLAPLTAFLDEMSRGPRPGR